MIKFLALFAGLLYLTGCASSPVRIRVANCEYLGAGLYECEQIPAPDVQRPNH